MAKTRKRYSTVTTYLVVKGAKDVLSFIKKAFDADVDECHKMPDGKIMHAEAKIGDTRIMMSEVCTGKPIPAMLYMYVPDVDATYKKAIKAGGTSLQKPADQFYGDRAGAVKDKGGNHWWIATRVKNVSSAEIDKVNKKTAKAKKKS